MDEILCGKTWFSKMHDRMPLVVALQSFSLKQQHQKYIDSDDIDHTILYQLMSNTTFLILTLMSKGLQTPGKKTEIAVRQRSRCSSLKFCANKIKLFEKSK